MPFICFIHSWNCNWLRKWVQSYLNLILTNVWGNIAILSSIKYSSYKFEPNSYQNWKQCVKHPKVYQTLCLMCIIAKHVLCVYKWDKGIYFRESYFKSSLSLCVFVFLIKAWWNLSIINVFRYKSKSVPKMNYEFFIPRQILNKIQFQRNEF